MAIPSDHSPAYNLVHFGCLLIHLHTIECFLVVCRPQILHLHMTAYLKEEMLANIGALLTVDKYKRAEKVILLLMQPQVKQIINAEPVGKKRAKNLPRGTRTTSAEFMARPTAGTQQMTNLASISPFEEDGDYNRGRFGKQLWKILGTDKLPILPSTYGLALLLTIKAHSTAHMAGSDMYARSRLEAWIVRARHLGERLLMSASCVKSGSKPP